jgi:tetratricopeptide (TPR) repeat protein
MLFHALILIVLSLVPCAVSAEEPAVAAPASSAAMTEARVHFNRGVDLYREGSYDAAKAEFERANALAPNYKLLYNLGQVQAERHEYVSAVKLLTEYLERGGAEINPERQAAVAQDLEKLKQRIAALTVDVNVEGAQVFIDDESRGTSPLRDPILVNAGTVRVRVEKEGYASVSQTITVAGVDQPRIILVLKPSSPVQPSAASEPGPRTVVTHNLAPFWASLCATVVLAGATATFGILTSSADDKLDEQLNRFPARSKDLESARSKLRTMAALTDGFGAGTLVAAATAVYFLASPPEHTEVVPTVGAHARLTPTLTGVSLSGEF